ncbi:MAG: hypothetical protein K5657_08195 [Desulfovibrio sp.]|nr:hypothetical protein [Desulfovibrio sp.]
MLQIIKALFLKEYVKTRAAMLFLLLLGALAILWIGVGTNRLFMLDHPEIVWYHTMDLHQIPYRTFSFFPLFSALIFCFCQFLPEMRDERMRIALHLPCPLWLLMFGHLAFGLLFLLLLFAALVAALLFMLCRLYPAEAVVTALFTTLPWCIAGIYAYLCCAFVLLEPRKKTRLLGIILFFSVTAPLLANTTPGAFETGLLPFLTGIPLLLMGLFLPALHYRTREVE